MTDRERLIEIVKNSLIKHIDKSCCLAENIVDDLLAENVTTLPIAFSDNRRERMIELLGGYYEETGLACVHYFTDDESEMLADYILADGWIRPPCKVGDTVYYLSGKYEKQGRKKVYVEFVDKAEVDNIVIGQKGVPQIDVCNAENEWTMFDSKDDFGKIVFLTLEEAEKALAERTGNK